MKIPIGISDLTDSRFLGRFQEYRQSFLETGMDYVSATNRAWEEANGKNFNHKRIV